MYDFFFYVRDRRWPCDPRKRQHVIASDARQAWRKFEAAYPQRRYEVTSMEHNMFNTSLFL